VGSRGKWMVTRGWCLRGERNQRAPPAPRADNAPSWPIPTLILTSHLSPFTFTLTLTLTRRAGMVALDMEPAAAAGLLRQRWLPSHTPSQPLDAPPLTYQEVA